jgi:hypothetical protein
VAAVSRLVLFALAAWPLCAAGLILNGHVVDENNAPVIGAHVKAGSEEAQTDPDGAFHITLPAAGEYRVSVEREGYYALKDRALRVDANQEATLVINTVREVFQSQDVNEETSPVNIDQSQNQERLTGTEINAVPYTNSHSLRSSLILMPGVIEDQSGTLHVNGSSENQVNYVLNDFNITNPISGQFQTNLAVEGIRSVDVLSNQFSPQFGRGSAGVLNIQTENGTDRFHYTATDFIPGLSFKQGVRLGNWYPRFGVSGPILKGKAWFSDIFDAVYTNSLITGLPHGEDTRSGFAGSNLMHTQVNLTPSNILYADFLVNVDNEGRLGLAPLNPIETTTSLHNHEYFTSIKDQAFFGHGALIEFGYAHTEFANAQTPQGDSLYVISTAVNTGNYFLDARQNASRDEGMVHAYLPKFTLLGSHQVEVGTDADWLRYYGDFNRTGYQVLGLAGQLLSETVFPSPATFQVSDTDAAGYALDTWRVAKGLEFTAGIRADRDRRIDRTGWSPRAAFSWSPFGSDRTRISGGFAQTDDAVTMDILGRPLDQVAYTTQYAMNGTPLAPPAATSFAIASAGLVLPRATNWNLAFDRQFGERVFVTAKYLRRRGTREFAFENTLAPDAPPSLLPLPGGDAPGVYQLTNQRRDNYDAFQAAVRKKLSGQYEFMVSYTHSRALSNAVLDSYTTQPLQVLPNLVPMPWDAPNRLLAWAYFPLPQNYRLTKNWAVSVLADARSGFPFSVRDETGVVVGAFDSYRYPRNFDLNLAIERLVTLRGYRFALRGGVDNLTNQSNPTAVYNVIGSPDFRHFLGDEGRHYVVRIRFFGRAGK